MPDVLPIAIASWRSSDMMLVWVVLCVLPLVLLYRLAKQHLWLVFGGAANSPNPFATPARYDVSSDHSHS